MGVNRVGFIDPTGQNKNVTLNGVISNPFAAALNAFTGNRFCELAEKAESYYRSIGLDALANILYANRDSAGCTVAPHSVSRFYSAGALQISSRCGDK